MRNRVITALAAAFASAASGGFVLAADLSRPNITPPPFVYNWNGFYLGGHVGYAWARGDGQMSDQTGASLGSDSIATHGLIGGAQIGFNYAVAPSWVLGLEADFTGARLNTTTLNSAIAGQREYRLSDFGTVRGRIGYAWERLMIYGTGGYAWAHEEIVRTQVIGQVNAAFPGIIESDSGLLSGWTAGIGAEWGVSPGWTLRAEYLHLDLGSRPFTFPAAGQQIAASAQIDLVRFGVNYIFNLAGPRPY